MFIDFSLECLQCSSSIRSIKFIVKMIDRARFVPYKHRQLIMCGPKLFLVINTQNIGISEFGIQIPRCIMLLRCFKSRCLYCPVRQQRVDNSQCLQFEYAHMNICLWSVIGVICTYLGCQQSGEALLIISAEIKFQAYAHYCCYGNMISVMWKLYVCI